MKKILLSFFCFAVSLLQAQFGPQPPFTIEIEAVTTPQPVPGLHSFAFAQSGSRWLFVGGRVNGLHGFSTNNSFDPQHANSNIVVIDTSNWQTYTAPVYTLGHQLADPLLSTNMQSIREGNYLYMFGGFGWDSIGNRFTTFPTVTALHVDSIINAVVGGTSISPWIRQITDTTMRVCGGEMLKLGNDIYLCFGHDFRGRYSDPPIPTFTQKYTRSIKKFNISDNGTSFQITNYSEQIDTNNFHRRDLNLGPIIKPDGSQALMAYSGVFQKNVNHPWPHPILIEGSGTSLDTTLFQKIANYTCGMLPVYDSLRGDMYTVFFGGTAWYYYNAQQQNLVFDSLVPFVRDISLLTHYNTGQWAQSILPPQMPGLHGSNQKFIPVSGIAQYSNEVIHLRNVNGRQLAGYLYGGIGSSSPNLPPGTWAVDTVYRVYITPDMNLLHSDENHAFEFLRLFPNPARDKVCLRVKPHKSGTMIAQLIDAQGKLISTSSLYVPAAQQDTWFDTSSLASGLYFVRVSINGSQELLKLTVDRR